MVHSETGYWIWSNQKAMWWKPNWLGYTRSLNLAGVYSHVEAKEILARANRTLRPNVDLNEYAIPARRWDGKE